MFPIHLKLYEEEPINVEEGGETKIPLYIIFDYQTSIYFCVLQGKDKAKNWYCLHNDICPDCGKKNLVDSNYCNKCKKPLEAKKEGDKFAELTFAYSKNGGFDVYTLDGTLSPIKDIQKHFNELNEKNRDLEILGIKKDKETKELIAQAWGAQKRIFSNEKDLSYIFSNARDRLEKEVDNRGFTEVAIDFSNVDIYLDDNYKGTVQCTFNYQPISSRIGEHRLSLKLGSDKIGSTKVNINRGEITKVNIPIRGTTQVPSRVTLSLLVLLAIMSALDIIWSPSFLFIFYLVSFIGIFYKLKWGSGLAIFSGLIVLLPFDLLSLLLGIVVIGLGWKEYSTLKTSYR